MNASISAGAGKKPEPKRTVGEIVGRIGELLDEVGQIARANAKKAEESDDA